MPRRSSWTCFRPPPTNTRWTGRRLKPGDVIRFAEPLRFSDGTEGCTFRVKKERFAGANRATTFFTCIETGKDCRISRVMARDWTRI